jgi:hypothetical protein
MSFYKTNYYYKFHEKNVMYIAYIGKIGRQETYKYGVTKNLFKRDYEQHRKTFPTFDMLHVKPTYNIYHAEDLFEKELKLRNLHRQHKIAGKQHTELFTLTEDYDMKFIKRLINRISLHADRDIHDAIKKAKSAPK